VSVVFTTCPFSLHGGATCCLRDSRWTFSCRPEFQTDRSQERKSPNSSDSCTNPYFVDRHRPRRPLKAYDNEIPVSNDSAAYGEFNFEAPVEGPDSNHRSDGQPDTSPRSITPHTLATPFPHPKQHKAVVDENSTTVIKISKISNATIEFQARLRNSSRFAFLQRRYDPRFRNRHRPIDLPLPILSLSCRGWREFCPSIDLILVTLLLRLRAVVSIIQHTLPDLARSGPEPAKGLADRYVRVLQ